MKNMIDDKKFDDKKLFNTKELHYNIEKIRVSSPWINRIEDSSKVFGVNLSREEKHE